MEPTNDTPAGKSKTVKRGKTLYDRLPARNKEPTMRAYYLSLDSTLSPSQLRQAMLDHWGCTPKQLSEMSSKAKWPQQRKDMLALRMQQDDLARVMSENEVIRENIPSSQLARLIKDFAWYGTSVAARHIRHNGQMHRYYVDLINSKIIAVGGHEYLDDYTRKEISLLEKKVTQYFNSLKDFVKPQALASMLHTINFADSIPKEVDGVEQDAFTVASLQKYYTEVMGATGLLQNAPRALESFQKYEDTGELPDILGTR